MPRKQSSKRELINTGTDKRHVQRGHSGRFSGPNNALDPRDDLRQPVTLLFANSESTKGRRSLMCNLTSVARTIACRFRKWDASGSRRS